MHDQKKKTYSNFFQSFYFPKAPIGIKVLCNDCITCHLNKPDPQIAEVSSYIKVIVDAFMHSLALNPVTHCNAYYAYTTLYEH